MASTYKVLGQSAPADTNATVLYTVPANGQAVVSTLVIANVTASQATCGVNIGVNGAANSDANALAKGVAIPGNSIVALTLGVTADAADVIRVTSSAGNALTFQAFGLEIV